MQVLSEIEVANVSGGSFAHDLGALVGDAYHWYEANALAINDGYIRGERF